MAGLSLKAIVGAVDLLKNSAARHDYMDTKGDMLFDMNTGAKFCWKHLEWES